MKNKPYRISDGRMHGYRIGNLYDTKQDTKDITNQCLRRMLAPIVLHDMALYTVSVLGRQGSGKTEVCKYLAYNVQNHYGAENVNTIFADNPSIAYPRLDDKPVQLMVIDDAAQELGSQSGKREELDEWFMIRHKAEDASGCDTGRIIAIFNWQRYSSVHPNFRNPDLWMFSSPMADNADVKHVRSRIGGIAYDSLSDNWNTIDTGDISAKSNVIARIPVIPLPAGSGWFFSQYMRNYDPDWKNWPEMLRTGKVAKRTREEAIAQIREDERYELQIMIYDAYESGKTQVEIAEKHGLAQYQVSRTLKKLDEVIAEKMKTA